MRIPSLQRHYPKKRILIYSAMNIIGLIAVLYVVDFQQFLEYTRQIRSISIVLIFLTWLLIVVFHAWRFATILDKAGRIKISIGRAIQYLQMGSLTNIVVPRTGEFTRLIVTSEEGPLGGIAVSIILEKFIDLVTAALVSLCSLLLFMKFGTFQSEAAYNVAIFATILCVSIILFFILILIFREYGYKLLDRFIATFEKFRPSKKDKVLRQDAKRGAERFLGNPIAFGKVFIPSLGIWVFYAVSIWIILHDLGLQDLVGGSFLVVQLATLFGLLVITLPIPAFGAYEGAIGFAIGGTTPLAATKGATVALIDHLFKTVFSLFAGLIATFIRSYVVSKELLRKDEGMESKTGLEMNKLQ